MMGVLSSTSGHQSSNSKLGSINSPPPTKASTCDLRFDLIWKQGLCRGNQVLLRSRFRQSLIQYDWSSLQKVKFGHSETHTRRRKDRKWLRDKVVCYKTRNMCGFPNGKVGGAEPHTLPQYVQREHGFAGTWIPNFPGCETANSSGQHTRFGYFQWHPRRATHKQQCVLAKETRVGGTQWNKDV